MTQLADTSLNEIIISMSSFIRKVLKLSPNTSFGPSTPCAFPSFSMRPTNASKLLIS